MKHHGIVLATAALWTAIACTSALAQTNSAPAVTNQTPAAVTNPDDANVERKFQDIVHSQRARDVQGKTAAEIAKAKADSLAEATVVARALQLSCDVKDADTVTRGKAKVNGQAVTVQTYEIACGNGMGYFVTSQDPQPPTGFSCFAAEGQRVAAAKSGQKFEDVCLLPANADVNTMATNVMSYASKPCTVRKMQWFGQSAVSKTEYTEVACADGTAYFIATPLPGSSGLLRTIGCADGAKAGLNCQLTVGATVATAAPADEVKPSYDAFKASLAQHGVACTASDIRVIGQESTRKRHVVEFKCPEQPKGLVAFIPLGSNPNPFQTLDCAGAAKVGAVCKLTTAN